MTLAAQDVQEMKPAAENTVSVRFGGHKETEMEVSVVNVLLVTARERLYALPLDNVVEVVRAQRSDVKTAKGKAAMTVRDRIVPLVWLSDVFASPGTRRGGGLQDSLLDVTFEEAAEQAKSALERAASDPRTVPMAPDAALAVLRELLDENRFLEAAFVARRDGRVIAGPLSRKGVVEKVAGIEVARQDWSARSWFRNAIQGATYVSEKYVSAATNSVCVTVSTPVRDASGELVGVLGADVSAAVVTDRLYVVIVNDDSGQTGVVVDEIVGKRDVDVEPLSFAVAGANLLGTTVLDGEGIAMVVDMERVVSVAS